MVTAERGEAAATTAEIRSGLQKTKNGPASRAGARAEVVAAAAVKGEERARAARAGTIVRSNYLANHAPLCRAKKGEENWQQQVWNDQRKGQPAPSWHQQTEEARLWRP